MTTPPPPQTIEQLQQRFRELQRLQVAAETRKEGALARLQQVQADARSLFGTDDVAVLTDQLAAMKAKNEQSRAAYQSALDVIERELTAVERDLRPPTA